MTLRLAGGSQADDVRRIAVVSADLVVARPALRRADPFGDVPDFASLLGS